MDSIRQYFKRTDKMYLLLCISSSVMAVLALSSWAAKQGNGFATDEVTGAIIGIGDYRRALVQAGAAAIGIVIALLLSCVDYRSLVKVWPVHVVLTWGLVLPTLVIRNVSIGPLTIGYNAGDTDNYSWYKLGGFTFQPTELAKISFILTFAMHLNKNGVVTGIKAGNCTVTATAGGKSASCAVTVEVVETAQLIYSLPGETVLTQGLDTGLKLLEHASTETPQYTILVDAKAGDDFNANTWPAFLHCLTETGDTDNLPGFNSTSSPLNNKTEFAYYNYGGVTLSDSIEHLKTRTRYAVQIDGRKYRGGSTYCPLTEWKTTNGTIIDVPQTFLIGAAQSADGSKKQQFWSGTLYQCRVYKGLLSDDKVNDYIEKGW